MAMSNTRLGTALANTFRTFAAAQDPEAKMTDAYLEQIWQAAAQDIIDEITNFSVIELKAGDLQVVAAGLLLDGTGQPCTGTALNIDTGDLNPRIK